MASSKFFKYKNWEYWPSFAFYIPNVPFAMFLALKAKSLVFFSATNPAIKHSGNGSESKYASLKLIPKKFTPASIFIKADNPIEKSLSIFEKSKIKLPIIVKPDVGFRGLLVKLIKSKKELQIFLEKHNHINLIIQEYVDYKNECGILYYRYPNEEKGKISSITLKKFISIIGDGFLSIKELIKNDKRAFRYYSILKENNPEVFESILKKGEEKVLTVIGNHSKGTKFINGNHLISNELERSFDSIFHQIPNWFYGRVDLKYNSFEELKKLKNFKIIEINGIISEPTHIYDSSKISYFGVLKEIRKHWKIVYEISILNHNLNNIKYDKISPFIKSLINLRRQIKRSKFKR